MWLVSHKHAQYLLYHLQPAHKPVEVDGNGNEQIKHEVSAFSSLLIESSCTIESHANKIAKLNV